MADRNLFAAVTRAARKYWFNADVGGTDKPPLLLNNETLDAINAAGSGVVAIAKVTTGDVVDVGTRTVTKASGDSIGIQSRFAQGATTTGDVYGVQIQPRIANTFGAANIVGAHFEPIMKGTGTVTGDISGDVRAVQTQVTDENVAGRTVGGDVVVGARIWHQLAQTVTGDVCAFKVEAHGGARQWTCFAKLAVAAGLAADKVSSGVAFSALDSGGNRPAKFYVKIGSTVYVVPAYNNA